MRARDIPKPTAGDDGVLIKVKAVGVCGTDLHTYALADAAEAFEAQINTADTLKAVIKPLIKSTGVKLK